MHKTAELSLHLADIAFDLGPCVNNLILQHGIVHHLLQLIADGVTEVTSCAGVCQVVVPAGKHHCGEREQLVAAHKRIVSLALDSNAVLSVMTGLMGKGAIQSGTEGDLTCVLFYSTKPTKESEDECGLMYCQ